MSTKVAMRRAQERRWRARTSRRPAKTRLPRAHAASSLAARHDTQAQGQAVRQRVAGIEPAGARGYLRGRLHIGRARGCRHRDRPLWTLPIRMTCPAVRGMARFDEFTAENVQVNNDRTTSDQQPLAPVHCSSCGLERRLCECTWRDRLWSLASNVPKALWS
jgi:hypothetical protein